MKIFKWILIIVVGFVVLAAGFLWYMGMFSEVKAAVKSMGPYTYAYERYVGDYKATGKVFAKVYDSLKKDGIKTDRAIGVYYDDPIIVPAEKLRSDCGAIIEEKDFLMLPKLLEKYKIRTLPQGDRLVAEFPIKNFLSYMIGPAKVYPVLMKYVRDNKLNVKQVYEVYDMPARKSYYIMDTGS